MSVSGHTPWERRATEVKPMHPIGLQQMGLAETIAHVIGLMPGEEQGLFWANIGFMGGLTLTDQLGERL